MHLERSGNFEPVGGLVLGFVRHWAPRSHLSESYVLKEIESVWQVETESGGKLAPLKRLRVAGKLVVSFRFCPGVRCSGFCPFFFLDALASLAFKLSLRDRRRHQNG